MEEDVKKANSNFNPFKAAAMAMQKAVADDGITTNLKTLRDQKKKAGEAPPEPRSPQEHQTHGDLMAHGKGLPASAPDGEGEDIREQAMETKASGHTTKEPNESADDAEDRSADDSGAVSAVDRIHQAFNSKHKKRTVTMDGKHKGQDAGLRAHGKRPPFE